MSYNPNNPNGQSTSANSAPVVIASNQSNIGILQNGVTFLFSTLNSSVAQLASGATFTGTVEDITAYPALSLMAFADQDLTVTVNQFIDAGGTKIAEQNTYSLTANEKFAYSYPINGNYIQVSVKNEGGSTTTTLQLDTAYGVIDQTNEIKDDFLRGQATQTATVNNILTPTSGTASVDVSKYRAFVCQVVSTGTAGTFIFEGSNDNVNFQAAPVYNQALAVKVPIITAITATNSSIMYEGSCNFKFIRLRIATTITGGSIRAFCSFLHSTLGATSQIVSNGTAANLLVTASGTVTANNNAGTAAHSAATSGNPVYVGGKVAQTTIAAQDTTLLAGDMCAAPMTTGQQLITKNFATAELDYTTNFSSVGSVTTVQPIVPASGTASVRNYISSIAISSDALGSGGLAWVLDSAVNVTSIAITTGLATTGTHDLKIGDAVVFTALAAGTGVSTNTVYYVTSVGSATTFNFSLTIGGANVVPSVAYTGTTMHRLLYQQHLRATGIPQTVMIVFKNPLRGIANSITNLLIPTTLTSGTIYLTVNGYRGF